ncbi:hypothetical protein MU458_15210, partial [Staphylococcus aureus]|nr:hypothetical protein [Staphylococcus aureus]
MTISNSLQTNATLLNDAWCRLFRDNNFTIGISLEGSEDLQNHHRPGKRGEASYPAVLRGITLLQHYRV